MRTFITCFVVLLVSCSVTSSQWKRLEGPNGGNVHKIAVNGSTVFAALRESSNFEKENKPGLYRSTDNGMHWMRTSAVDDSMYVSSISVIGSTVLVATDEGITRSSDNGNTWGKTKGIKGIAVNCISVVGNMIFAGTDSVQAVYYSKDDGISWFPTRMEVEKDSAGIWAIQACGTMLFANGYPGLYRSSDYGESWAEVKSEIGVDLKAHMTVKGKTLYVGTDSGKVLRTNDYGDTWNEIFFDKRNSWIRNITVNGGLIYILTSISGCMSFESHMYKSANDGASWEEIKEGKLFQDPLCIAINESNLFVGTRLDGVFKTTDNCKTWTALNSSLQKVKVGSLSVIGSEIYVKSRSKFEYDYIVYNNGENWVHIDESSLLSKKPFIAGTIVSIYDAHTVFGQSRYPFEREFGLRSNRIYVNTIGYTGVNLVANTNKGIFYSNNRGQTWSERNETVDTSNISCMTISGKTVFAGSEKNEIFCSRDDGQNWAKVFTGNPKVKINCLIVSNSLIVAGTSAGLIVSTDGGKSWDDMYADSLQEKEITSVAVCNGVLLVGTSNAGVFYSMDNGKNWQEINGGLPKNNKKISKLTVNGSIVFTEFYDEGVWKLNVNSLGVTESIVDNSFADNLTCYPNPVTDFLRVEYKSLIPKNTAPIHYTLSTITGRVVKEFNTTEPTICVSLYGLASGVYCLTAWQGAAKAATMVTVSE